MNAKWMVGLLALVLCSLSLLAFRQYGFAAAFWRVSAVAFHILVAVVYFHWCEHWHEEARL